MIGSISRQIGLGRLLYCLWHRPRSLMVESIRAGGPIEQWRTARGQDAMRDAARELPRLPESSGSPLIVHVLTGKRFWYQTVFCLWTLAHTSNRTIVPTVLDDGSLTADQFGCIQRLFPLAALETEHEITTRLDQYLPASRFPSLRARRAHFALLRKLTDVHVGRKGWRLFLDSDLLFFHEPRLLLDWIDAPRCNLHATDVEYAYGYPRKLLAELAGQPVQDFINTGILGLCSEEIDWSRMESWCRTLIERAGPHYYQEQALVALHLAGRSALAAPLDDYVTYPRGAEAVECKRVMHHYVAQSKHNYFRHNWLKALAGQAKSNSQVATRPDARGQS